MAHKSILLFASFAAFGMTPLLASAEDFDKAEADLFRAATVTVQTAGQTALTAHPGTLAAVGFNDENGKGVYEALVVDTDGTPWTVKIDAMTGAVLASGQSALMGDDEEDHDAERHGDGRKHALEESNG